LELLQTAENAGVMISNFKAQGAPFEQRAAQIHARARFLLQPALYAVKGTSLTSQTAHGSGDVCT
jgi:hypothetical protein